MRCTRCGSELESDLSFCTNCGMPLDGAPVNSKKGSGNGKGILIVAIVVTVILIFAVILYFLFGEKSIRKEASLAKDEVSSVEEKTELEEEEGNAGTVSLGQNNFDTEKENGFNQIKDESKRTDSKKENENNYESQKYMLDESDSRYITESELDRLTKEEIKIARNELYARHGRKFDDEGLRRYFSQFDWYHPTIEPDDFKESMLNEYEIANRDFIVQYEEEHGYR